MPGFLGSCDVMVPMGRDRLCQPGAGSELSRLAVTQMCLQEIFIALLSASAALCARAEAFTDCSHPWTEGRKRWYQCWGCSVPKGLMFCSPWASHPIPSVRNCPLLGRSERCCIQNLLRGGRKKRVKSNRENHFPSQLPELCSLRLKVGQYLEFRAYPPAILSNPPVKLWVWGMCWLLEEQDGLLFCTYYQWWAVDSSFTGWGMPFHHLKWNCRPYPWDLLNTSVHVTSVESDLPVERNFDWVSLCFTFLP